MGSSPTEINFLDVTVKRNGDKVKTDFFCKATDTHRFFYSQSFHRNVHQKSIAYGQAIRIKRIPSTEDNLGIRFDQLKQRLVAQGYKEHQVESEIKSVHSIERSSLFGKPEKLTDNHITPITQHHPVLNQVLEVLCQVHRHVLKSRLLKGVLPSPPRIAF